MPETTQVTLSVTVEDAGARSVVRILTDALVQVLTDVDVEAASVSLFRDDFLQAEAAEKPRLDDEILRRALEAAQAGTKSAAAEPRPLDDGTVLRGSVLPKMSGYPTEAKNEETI
jgi:hypothetical protein